MFACSSHDLICQPLDSITYGHTHEKDALRRAACDPGDSSGQLDHVCADKVGVWMEPVGDAREAEGWWKSWGSSAGSYAHDERKVG
jgi:hypothetical protein